MSATVVLFGTGMTVLFGFLTVVFWGSLAERPAADWIRSEWLKTIAAGLLSGAVAVAVGLLVLDGLLPNRGLGGLSWLILPYAALAALLAWCAIGLVGAVERWRTERAWGELGATPRIWLLPVWAVVLLSLLATVGAMVLAAWIVISTSSPGEITTPEGIPRVVPPLVVVAGVGSLCALASGLWQHRRHRREDDRIRRSDMEQAAEISSPPDGPEDTE